MKFYALKKTWFFCQVFLFSRFILSGCLIVFIVKVNGGRFHPPFIGFI